MPTTIPDEQLRNTGAGHVRYVALNAEAVVIDQRAVNLAGTVLAIAFTGAQCDIPRSLIVDDNGVGAGNTGNITVTGLNEAGVATVEVIAINTLGVVESNAAFTYISQIDYPAITDTNVEVQMGSKVGIATDFTLNALTSIAKNGVFMLPAAFTLDPANATVEETGVPIVAADTFDYYLYS